jgi:flagellar assembly factor FliW
MQIRTLNWGELEIPDDQAIHLPEGLLGFEELHRFVFLDIEEFRPFVWLVSVDDPELSFAVADPCHFHPGAYPVTLSDADETLLDLEAGDSVAVFVIVAVSPKGEVTANLKGPIVLNMRNRRAKQLVTYGSSLSVRQPILKNRVVPLENAVEARTADV